MSGPLLDKLPNDLPSSARVGLSGPDARVPARLADLPPAEQARLARHALLHALLPLALEDDDARRAFAEHTTSAIVPDAAPFTQRVVSQIAPSTARQARRTSTRVVAARQPTGRTSRLSRTTRRFAHKRPIRGRFGSYLLPATLATAVAACVVLAVVLRVGDASIATMANSESATWQSAPGPLIAGVRLRLAQGLVELDLHGKGKLVLDGPADLELASASRAILRSGRLVLNVTPAGHGYRVETPGGTFIDLGTRFGVIVGADGTSEAHVMEGSIAAQVKGSTSEVILTQDKAARFRAGRLESIAADPGAFYTRLPPHTVTAPDQIHWRLDDGTGNTARAEVRGFPSTAADLTLKSTRGSPLPQWISGHHGRALAFDGRGGYAESGFPGIGGTQPRTVSCWIRMPRDFTPADGFAIVSWGHPMATGRGEVWQISLNPLKHDGPLGRIRVGTHGGILVGSTDLRDDRWHHVAIVMFGGVRPNIGTHVLAYVDGELEPISRRTLLTIDTRILDDGHGVWVGRNVTHTDDQRTSPHGFLRGAVDDLVISAGALSQAEIRELMRER
jgi:hypothetical protein